MDVALQELAEAVKLDPKNAKIYNVYGLVYAMLGRGRERAAQFPAGARARAERFRDPPELGLVPVHARPARASRFRSSSGGAQPAVQDARHRADQRRQAARASSATRQRAEEYLQARAQRESPDNPTAAYSLSLLAYREGAARRGARADEAASCSRPTRRRTRCTSACASSASWATAAPEASYVSQLRNRYPDSPEAKAIADREPASDRTAPTR